MNQSNLLNRMELYFWNFAIQVLSQSRMLQIILRRVFGMLKDVEIATFGILLGVSGVVGLVSGYLFYFVSAGPR
jgi:hypothetical protein